MPTFKKYAQLLNDECSRADEFFTSDITLKDIPTGVGDDVSSLHAWKAMKSHVVAKQTQSVSATVADHSLGDGIEAIGLGGTMFDPYKVAKIKADAGVTPIE